MRWMILAILFGQSVNPRAQTLISKMGEFSDVDSGDEGEHCSGTSVSMWKISDSSLIGILDIHSGLCGDPPCSFIQGKYKNNRLEFRTTDSIWGEFYSFQGFIKHSHLIGKLNSDTVNLKRESSAFQSDWDNDISPWCKFWSKVPRCQGIKTFCSTYFEGK